MFGLILLMFCCGSSIGKNKKSICSMSKEEEEEVVFDLPEDVVVKILLHLPVKSLLRFTCVSKRWHSIISDSQFARSAFEVASQTRTLRSRLLFSTYPYYQIWDFSYRFKPSYFQCLGDSDVSCLEEDPLVQSPIPPPGIITQRVMASCNGLIVLGGRPSYYDLYSCDYYTNLCVWNPTTGFFRKIPDPEVLMQIGLNSFICVAFAFGHVMATDDYKLVFFVSKECTVHIFSTREGSWKVVRFPHSSFPSFDDCDKGLLVSNGAIHWVSTGIPEAISAFDLVSEEFCQLPLPRALLQSIRHEDGRDPRRIWTQVLVGRRLCVRSRNEYWVMKQYGVPESWVKMFQFSVADLPNVFGSVYGWVPAIVTEGGTVVMLYDVELVRIECHREEELVCSGRYKVTSVPDDRFYSDVTVYDETLLSL